MCKSITAFTLILCFLICIPFLHFCMGCICAISDIQLTSLIYLYWRLLLHWSIILIQMMHEPIVCMCTAVSLLSNYIVGCMHGCIPKIEYSWTFRLNKLSLHSNTTWCSCFEFICHILQWNFPYNEDYKQVYNHRHICRQLVWLVSKYYSGCL